MRKIAVVMAAAVLVISGFISVNSLSAWEIDKVANLGYFYIPDSELKNDEGKIEMSSYQVWGVAPVKLSEKTALLPGLSYQGLYVDYSDFDFTYPNPDGGIITIKDFPNAFHAISLILGCLIDLDNGWSVFADFRPGIKSDMENIDSKDISYQGGALVSHRFSDALCLSLGLYYNDSFGEPQLLPLVGAQWMISDVLALDAVLPEYLLFSYQPETWLKLGLRGRVKGHEFRLSEKTPWKDSVLEYSQILVGPYADLYLTDHLVLRLEGGVATARKFKFRDDNSSRTLYDGDIKDGGFFGASIFYEY